MIEITASLKSSSKPVRLNYVEAPKSRLQHETNYVVVVVNGLLNTNSRLNELLFIHKD